MPEAPMNLKAGALANAEVFTSGGLNMSGTELLRVCVITDVAGTLAVEQSVDGATWFETLSQPVAAAPGGKGTIVESLSVLAQARVKYTNGGAGTMAGFRIDVDKPRTS